MKEKTIPDVSTEEMTRGSVAEKVIGVYTALGGFELNNGRNAYLEWGKFVWKTSRSFLEKRSEKVAKGITPSIEKTVFKASEMSSKLDYDLDLIDIWNISRALKNPEMVSAPEVVQMTEGTQVFILNVKIPK